MSAHHGGAGQGGLNGAFRGIATIVALGAMVFLAPRVWPLIDPVLWNELAGLYDYGTASWLHLGGKILIWPLTFLAARMTITGALLALVLLISQRAR